MAGGALTALDALVRAQPAWAGAWRQRQALAAACACVKLLRRREDQAALRDAFHLRRPGEEPGPGGNVLLAWRRLARRSSTLDAAALEPIAALLGVAWVQELDDLAATVAKLAGTGAPAPLVAARVAAAVIARQPGAEPLAWWLADLALAQRMRWPQPVPLLATQIHAPLLRLGEARLRARPGMEGFERAVCIALAAGAAEACNMAAAIATQAQRLQQVAPKLRSKGASEVVALLLDDDAVSGSLTTPSLSRWSSRRLFERLIQLDAVRELSGRDSFKLYGL